MQGYTIYFYHMANKRGILFLGRKKRLPGLKPGSGADRNSFCLPIGELNVVEPGLVSRVVASQVFLESHIQLIYAGIAGGVSAIHVMLNAIERYRDIRKRCAAAFEFPGQVMPPVSRGRVAGYTRRNPIAIGITPHVEVSSRDVALCAKNPPLMAVSLIAVKFQGLRVLGQLDVKIEVITQVGRPVGSTELFPPEGVGVRRAAGDGEDS